MIYPIVAYGDPILRKVTRPIEKDELDLKKLSEDLFETMYNASGVGLAAPQVGLTIRVFIVDGTAMNEGEEEEDKDQSLEGFKKMFINPQVLEESGEPWACEEGCLSIPGIRGLVPRSRAIEIEYTSRDGKLHRQELTDFVARIFQHEYDHLDGIVFLDRVESTQELMTEDEYQQQFVKLL